MHTATAFRSVSQRLGKDKKHAATRDVFIKDGVQRSREFGVTDHLGDVTPSDLTSPAPVALRPALIAIASRTVWRSSGEDKVVAPRRSPSGQSVGPPGDSSLNSRARALPLALQRPDLDMDSVLSLTVDPIRRLSIGRDSISARKLASKLLLRATFPCLEVLDCLEVGGSGDASAAAGAPAGGTAAGCPDFDPEFFGTFESGWVPVFDVDDLESLLLICFVLKSVDIVRRSKFPSLNPALYLLAPFTEKNRRPMQGRTEHYAVHFCVIQ